MKHRTFTANYPNFEAGRIALMPIADRLQASTDYSGRGVVIAFVDAGFFLHPDIADRVLIHVDASTNHVVEQTAITEIDEPMAWHGQMTSVIGAGDGRTSQGLFRSLAWESQLVLIKVSTPHRHVKEPDIMRGLHWLIDTHRRFGVRVVNISVGGDFPSADPNHYLHRAVRQLVQAGLTVVIAAGNRHQKEVVPPASSPMAITVGGYDDQNTLDREAWEPYHSNYGRSYDGIPKPDLIAPAVWIPSPILPVSQVAREARWLAPLLNGHKEAAIQSLLTEGFADLGMTPEEVKHPTALMLNDLQKRIHDYKLITADYHFADGTSVATPIVTSVVAQMLEVNPSLSPHTIKSILKATALPLASDTPEHQGAGTIHARAAVETAYRHRGD